jgi:hypothetical protein
MHILPTAIREFLCHTGTRRLVRSRAVSNDGAIVWNFVGVLIDCVSRHSNRTGQFLIGLTPRLRISRIDKRELLAAIQPLCDLVHCNSCYLHAYYL